MYKSNYLKSLANNRNFYLWLLIIISLLGTFLRLYKLGKEGFSTDELVTIRLVTDYGLFDMLDVKRPPLFLFAQHIWVSIFGTTEIAARTLNALIGAVSIPLTYVVGKQIYNRRVGIISAYFFTISVFLIYHAQTIRYYSFFALFAILSAYYYLKILNRNKKIDYIIFCIISVLSFYNHYLSVFLLFALNLHFAIHWNKFKKYQISWVVSQVLIFVLMSPRLIKGFVKMSQGKNAVMGWISMPEIYSPFGTALKFIGDIATTNRANLKNTIELTISTEIILIAILFLLVSTAIYIYKSGYNRWIKNLKLLKNNLIKKNSDKTHFLLLLLWFSIPLLMPLVLSYITGPMYINRYTIASAPALFIIIGLIFFSFRDVVPEYISVGFLTILIVPGLLSYYSEPQNIQYRESAYYLKKNAGREDLTILSGYVKGREYLWYYRDDAEFCRLPKKKSKLDDSYKKEIDSCINNRNKFWLVMQPGPHGFNSDVLSHLKSNKYNVIDYKSFYRINIYHFTRDILVD